MFLGHFGVGLAGKKADPKPSLGTLFLAAQFLDLIWPIFIITGVEKVRIAPGFTHVTPIEFTFYPYSHSLLIVLCWSFLFGSVYYFFRKNTKTSVLLGILVLSHWVLDLFVHIPDLPLFPGSDIKVGFGLWNSFPLTILIEGLIFAVGIYLYLSSTKVKNKKGSFGFWVLIIFLAGIYILNVSTPPPPNVEAIGYAGLLQWILIPWAYWIDRNRIKLNIEEMEQPAPSA